MRGEIEFEVCDITSFLFLSPSPLWPLSSEKLFAEFNFSIKPESEDLSKDFSELFDCGDKCSRRCSLPCGEPGLAFKLSDASKKSSTIFDGLHD
jgi:hypothetical protein